MLLKSSQIQKSSTCQFKVNLEIYKILANKTIYNLTQTCHGNCKFHNFLINSLPGHVTTVVKYVSTHIKI
jgi:hypothetical protein